MTSNGTLAHATKKTSSSLWSSLPVTALLRDEQEDKRDGFVLAAQGPNLLLIPWDGGQPHERLQVTEIEMEIWFCYSC